ncbi:MAG: hypothetical protein ABIR33_13670 [Pyrinomonadaceae bacterium]
MRNTISARRQRTPGFEAGTSREFAAFGNSPDQLAVVWGGQSGIVAASPQAGPGGSFSLDVARFPSDFNLGATLEMRRRNQLGLPQMSQRTVLCTAPSQFSERTRMLALDGEHLALDEDTLSEWLVNAEQQMLLGTDNHPIFETSLEDTASAVGRLPNGQVTLTEVPREHINNLRERMRSLVGGMAAGSLNLIVETPVRCAARYFLTRSPEGNEIRRPGKEAEVTAFLLISTSGFSMGLWSPKTGLFSEYSFLAPQELTGDPKAKGRGRPAAENLPSDARIDAYIKQALDQLFLQLSPERLEQMGLASYAQIVWGCEMGMSERVTPVAQEYAAKSGLEFIQLPVPADEAVAGGLLLGSFSFGNSDAIAPRVLPVVNLARDLLVQADTEEVERRRLEQVEATKRRNRTLFAIVAAPVMAFAILTAFAADIIRERVWLAYRESQADARATELKPALDRRRSYEANLQWYQEFVKQVSLLRKQQPITTSLLYQLDANYPFAIDPSFYVSEMRLTSAKGEIEIKGLARNKDAIAQFLKSLEFAGGSTSGSRLFGNLAYEVQEGVVQDVSTGQRPTLPQMAGSTLTGTNVAPGVVSWTVKGIYLPAAEIAPPDPNAKPAPGAPNPNSPAVGTPPAAPAK